MQPREQASGPPNADQYGRSRALSASRGFGRHGAAGRGSDAGVPDPYSSHGSPAVMDGRSVQRRSVEAASLGMLAIPHSPPGGYQGRQQQQQQQWPGGGGGGRGGPAGWQQQQQQQRGGGTQHPGHAQHPDGSYFHQQGRPHYGSVDAMMQQQQMQMQQHPGGGGGYPQPALPHHQMRASPQTAPLGDFAPTYASPMGGYGGQIAAQQQQQYGGGGAAAARELWPPQQGGRPMQPQHMHGLGDGGYADDGFGSGSVVGAPGPATPPAAHGAAFTASPGGGGMPRGPNARDSPGGKPAAAKAKLPLKKRPAPGSGEGVPPHKQAKKRKVQLCL